MWASTFHFEQDHIGGYLYLGGPHWKVPLLHRSTLEGTYNFIQKILWILILYKGNCEDSSKMILNFIVIQKLFGKYNHQSTDANFDSELVVEGVVLELQSLSAILKNFERSSKLYLMTKSLQPLLLLLNRYRSRQIQSR